MADELTPLTRIENFLAGNPQELEPLTRIEQFLAALAGGGGGGGSAEDMGREYYLSQLHPEEYSSMYRISIGNIRLLCGGAFFGSTLPTNGTFTREIGGSAYYHGVGITTSQICTRINSTAGGGALEQHRTSGSATGFVFIAFGWEKE